MLQSVKSDIKRKKSYYNFMSIHSDAKVGFPLWRKAVEKSVENVENLSLSTGIPSPGGIPARDGKIRLFPRQASIIPEKPGLRFCLCPGFLLEKVGLLWKKDSQRKFPAPGPIKNFVRIHNPPGGVCLRRLWKYFTL